MFWNKEIETLKTADLEALQLKRLKKTLSLARQVGFYQKRLDDAKIGPSSIKTLDNIKKIPFTKKQDLRDGYPFGFFAVPLKKIVRIHTTSGTTGKPTVVGYTQNDLNAWSDLIARNMTMVGITENDVFQNMVNYGMFTGGLGFHYGAEKIGATVIPSATGNTRRQIEMINDFGVTVIHCTPSYAMHLSEVAEEMGETMDSLKIGLFGAEPWSESVRDHLRTLREEKRLGVTRAVRICPRGV
jgi:phenylacetate-CoA ligase